MEILFTKYKIVNPLYRLYWNRLIENNEQIAHYNPVGAVKTMKGIAMEKYHAMEHRYPSKVDLIDKWGYDGKQLHHLMRVEEYLTRYVNGEPYADCLITKCPKRLKEIKDMSNPKLLLDEARVVAGIYMGKVNAMADEFAAAHKDDPVDAEVDKLLDEVQESIMRLGIILDLEKEGL